MTLTVQTTGRTADAAMELRRVQFAALGTRCELQLATADESAARAFVTRAIGWVEAFEAKYSRFRCDSWLSRVNAAAGANWVEADAEAEQLLALCDTLYFVTGGVLDPTILPLLRLWNYHDPQARAPGDEAIAAARRLVGWRKVQREPGRVFLPEPGMSLDFGGFGKEYAVDMVAQLALDHGLGNVLVDFGHDLRVLGAPPGRAAWHIGLENPRAPGTASGSVALAGNRGVASSGDYARRVLIGGKRFGHIVDPRTGRPVANGCVQATAIAGTCLQAGVLSTTAFVLGVPAGIEFIHSFPGAEGLLVTEQVRAQTRGFFRHVGS